MGRSTQCRSRYRSVGVRANRKAEVYRFANDEQAAGQEAVVDVKRTIVFLDNRLDEDRRVSGVPVEDVFRIAGVLGQRP